MPLKKGVSKDVVGSNIKEMVKAGHPIKQSIAAALAKKRKYLKMKDGGWAEGEDESSDEIIEDSERSMPDNMHMAEAHPTEVSDPETQDIHKKLAQAITSHSMEDEEMGEINEYADGGDVKPSPSPVPIDPVAAEDVSKSFKKALGFAKGGLAENEYEDEMLGNKPEQEHMDASLSEPMSDEPSKADSLDHKKERMPMKAMGLDEHTMNVIMERKKNRRFAKIRGDKK